MITVRASSVGIKDTLHCFLIAGFTSDHLDRSVPSAYTHTVNDTPVTGSRGVRHDGQVVFGQRSKVVQQEETTKAHKQLAQCLDGGDSALIYQVQDGLGVAGIEPNSLQVLGEGSIGLLDHRVTELSVGLGTECTHHRGTVHGHPGQGASDLCNEAIHSSL